MTTPVKDPRTMPKKGTRLRDVLDFVKSHPGATVKDVAYGTGYTEKVSREKLFELRDEQWVKRYDSDEIQGYWKFLELPDAGA